MYPWHCTSAQVASEPMRQFSQFKHESASHCIQSIPAGNQHSGTLGWVQASFRAGIRKRWIKKRTLIPTASPTLTVVFVPFPIATTYPALF